MKDFSEIHEELSKLNNFYTKSKAAERKLIEAKISKTALKYFTEDKVQKIISDIDGILTETEKLTTFDYQSVIKTYTALRCCCIDKENFTQLKNRKETFHQIISSTRSKTKTNLLETIKELFEVVKTDKLYLKESSTNSILSDTEKNTSEIETVEVVESNTFYANNNFEQSSFTSEKTQKSASLSKPIEKLPNSNPIIETKINTPPKKPTQTSKPTNSEPTKLSEDNLDQKSPDQKPSEKSKMVEIENKDQNEAQQEQARKDAQAQQEQAKKDAQAQKEKIEKMETQISEIQSSSTKMNETLMTFMETMKANMKNDEEKDENSKKAKKKKKKKKSKKRKKKEESTSSTDSSSSSEDSSSSLEGDGIFRHKMMVSKCKKLHPFLAYSLSLNNNKLSKISELTHGEISNFILQYMNDQVKDENPTISNRFRAYTSFCLQAGMLRNLDQYTKASLNYISQQAINRVDTELKINKAVSSVEVESIFNNLILRHGEKIMPKNNSSQGKMSNSQSFPQSFNKIRPCRSYNKKEKCHDNCHFDHCCSGCYEKLGVKKSHPLADCPSRTSTAPKGGK